MGESILTAQNLSKVVSSTEGALTILHPLSLELNKGDSLAIVGASGSGKSTLLGLLAGLDLPSQGEVILAGRALSTLDEDQRARVRAEHVGFVFQFYNLVGNVTALENVELAAQICKEPLDAAEVLREVGLAERMNNFPAQLSGGEQQRVAIARALAKNPKILLCDEPTGALDYNTGKAILKLLEDTCVNTGKTVIVITHNQAITQMADRIISVKSGKIESVRMNDKKLPVEEISW